jgi:hypothetical protein
MAESNTAKQVPAVTSERKDVVVKIDAPGRASQPANLASAVETMITSMHEAVSGMAPDDISLEVDCSQDGERSNARLRFRAYKRAKA